MEKSLGPRKVLRAPALRRGREIIPISDRVKLERVLGFTLSNNAAFDCDPHSSIVAYPAGCVVVLYNVRKNKQSHILSSSKKTLTSLAFSNDGKYLATGECGHQPHVRVWDVQEKNQIAEFQGHKYGINCVAFSPNLKYVVSVGSQHDMIVNVWDWKNNVKVASNKVSCKVKAISFAANGNYFVTVGNRHVKFWYLEYSRSAKHKLEPVPLMGRSAILGDQRNNNFCDVACGKGEMSDSTYAITKSGLLCEFNSRRLLDKWVELRTTSANSISVREQFIFIGCASGVIRCFSPFDLNFICTLPKPHYLGVDVARGAIGCKPIAPHPANVKYPDTIAIALDETNKKVTCIYNDHSLYVWDIKDMKKIGKSHSFFYHSACIWGIETYPNVPEESEHVLPKGTFLTCSSDDTIRFWNLDPNLAQDSVYHRNIFSSELLKILYIDPELSYLCDMDSTPSGSGDKGDTTYDGKNGVRCLRISPNGRHLASGDRSGNIRIHDLEFVEELCKVEAHDSEVLCLEYSRPVTIDGEEKKFLASASRDRLIHVFDVKQDYSFQETLDDHSSSITAVRFVQNEGLLQMISCGADKSIIFRKAQFNPHLYFTREHHVVGKTTLYDMEVDIHQRHILTACQDRNIRVYSVVNGKQVRYFRGSQGEDGTLIKVSLDPSGTYLATSCTDKSLYIYDYFGGECLATMFGHSELVTGLKFTDDGQHLISVSGDGCIFIWRLPTEVTQNMLSKMVASDSSLPNLWQNGRKSSVGITKPVQLENNIAKKPISTIDLVNGNNMVSQEHSPEYRFSMGQLPLWAKKQMLEELSSPSANPKLAPPVPPRGRWAQRIDGQGLVVRSYLDSDSVIPYPNVSGSENMDALPTAEKVHETLQSTLIKTGNENMCFEVSDESFKQILSESPAETSGGPVTIRRSADSYSNNKRGVMNESEDASVITSMGSMRVEDMDAEDERSDSEISETVYYPVSEDGSDKGDGNFHVCANSEDSKNSVKPIANIRSERQCSNAPVMSTPEQAETNSDEEDASTPVDSDRSFLSGLCVSTENLERLGQREKFMRSNYESLEKEDAADHDSDERSLYRQSISAKFLAGSLVITNRPIISGPSKTPPVPDRQVSTPTSKREELNKALSEARRKLETVGFRSGLCSSKSIGDLHNMRDKDTYRAQKSGTRENNIRRATSMTDLSASGLGPRRLFSTSSIMKNEKRAEETAPLWNQSRMAQENSLSPSYSKSKVQGNTEKSAEGSSFNTAVPMSRSISMSSLHPKHRTSTPSMPKTPSVYSLSRTSTPKQNPETYTLGKSFYNNLSNSPSRRNNLPSLPPRTQPLSIVTTSTLATDSSSDSSPTESMPKPFSNLRTSVQRPRFLSTGENSGSKQRLQQSKMKSRSEWDLKNAGGKFSNRNGWPSPPEPFLEKNFDKQSETGDEKSLNLSFLSADPASVPLSVELCENISENLKRVTSYASQVYQRVSLSSELGSEDQFQMSNILAQSLWQAQQILKPAALSMPMWISPLASENRSTGLRPLPGLGSFPNGDHSESSLHRFSSETQLSQPEVIDTMAILQQFSDKLLSIVEQQISTKHNQPKPNE